MSDMTAAKSISSPSATGLNAYAAVTAFHVVHAHFRRAHPELHRLRNRIRHVVRTSTPFALWRLPSGQMVCGRATWVGTLSAECSEVDLDRIPPLSPPFSMTWSDSIDRPRITRALDHIFGHVRKPIPLEQLVETIAELFQLPVTPLQAGRNERIDETASIESSLVIRSALAEIWREVDLLPPRQRIALLLGLRDENGSSVTSLLIHLRIVTFAELAVAVELSSSQLSAIWDHLPLSDLAIAERLDLTRQQVINLRKSARERLGRRLLSARRVTRSNTNATSPCDGVKGWCGAEVRSPSPNGVLEDYVLTSTDWWFIEPPARFDHKAGGHNTWCSLA